MRQLEIGDLMFFAMKVEAFLRPEGSAARRKRADEFVDSAVDRQEVVSHLVIGATLRSTFRTDGLPLVRLQVIQQMKSELVVHLRKLHAANAAHGLLQLRTT